MATSSFCWNNDIVPKKPEGILEVDSITMVNNKLDVLIKLIERLDIKVVDIMPWYDMCREGYTSIEYTMITQLPINPNVQQVNLVNDNQKGQGKPYSNMYNLSCRNHPNFVWSNQP